MPVRCVLWSRSVPARQVRLGNKKVHLGIKTSAFYGQEGTAVDALTKLTVSLRVGRRDELMAKGLMQDVHTRMKKHDDLLVISGGFISYQTSFPEVFGRDYKVNTDPQSGECDLEMLLDTAQPGWRDVTIQRVFFPRIEAVGALPTAAALLGDQPWMPQS